MIKFQDQNQINDEEMRTMNYQVTVEGKTTYEIAREFLEGKGLLGGIKITE